MKSAYELAMERLDQQSPAKPVTEEQKARLAELDQLYRAKIAEREVFLRDQIAKAQSAGQYEELMQLEQELTRDVKRLQEECEAKKERVRTEG